MSSPDTELAVFNGSKANKNSKLNLGCGHQKLEGFVNIDIELTEKPDLLLDLGKYEWPFATDSVDLAVASHILEHLTSEEFLHFMRELYRVLKPGAECAIVLPHPRHNVFVNDPTHKTALTPDSLAMLCQANFRAMIEKGGRITPLWRYNRVDFELIGPLQHILDARVTEEQRASSEWIKMEKYENNVVIEYRFAIKAIKPFIDEGEPEHKPKPKPEPEPKKSFVHSTIEHASPA